VQYPTKGYLHPKHKSLTRAYLYKQVEAYVLDMAKDDIILGVNVIAKHLVPLTTELLLHTGNILSSTATQLTAKLAATTGDLFAINSDLVGVEEQSAAPNAETIPIPTYVRGNVYPPLAPMEPVLEDGIAEDGSLFDLPHVTDTLYSTVESYDARVKDFKANINAAVHEPMGAFTVAMQQCILVHGLPVYTHRHWKGIKMKPVS